MPSSFIPFDIENDVVTTTDSIKQTKDDKYNNKESSTAVHLKSVIVL